MIPVHGQGLSSLYLTQVKAFYPRGGGKETTSPPPHLELWQRTYFLFSIKSSVVSYLKLCQPPAGRKQGAGRERSRSRLRGSCRRRCLANDSGSPSLREQCRRLPRSIFVFSLRIFLKTVSSRNGGRKESFKIMVLTVVSQPKEVPQEGSRIELARSLACHPFFPASLPFSHANAIAVLSLLMQVEGEHAENPTEPNTAPTSVPFSGGPAGGAGRPEPQVHRLRAWKPSGAIFRGEPPAGKSALPHPRQV